MKVVKTAVQVIGIIATVASFIPGPWQPVAAAVAAAATVVSAGLQLLTKPPRPQARGSPTSYLLDPSIGIPYMMGRTQFAGCCAKRETWDGDNQNQAFLTVYSLGPIDGFEQFTADQSPVNFTTTPGPDFGNAIGQLRDFMFLNKQVGLCPSPVFPCLQFPGHPNPPGYDPATFKLSGLAASWLWLRWDKKSRYFTSGPPVPGMVLRGVLVYDPRLDSTFPGGSGPCRAGVESTYVYSETPHLHALTYAIGRFQNGHRRFGIGMPVGSIDVSYFAEAASIDEANNWKVGGLCYSTDDKWNTLKLIMQAGGAQPIMVGGKLSGMQRRPRVASNTITSKDIVGRCSVKPTQTIRDRINGGVPRYRSEAHGWEYVPATVIRVPALVAEDGGKERTKEFPFELVQQVDQARQLTAYEIMDGREFGPIELTLKMRWIGLKPGDAVNLNIPELNLNNQKAIVINRSLDVQQGGVSLTLKSETDAKHAYCLGITGGAIPVPQPWQHPYSTANPPATPPAGQWTLAPVALASASGSVPALRFSGSTYNAAATSIEFSYREVGSPTWTVLPLASFETTSLDVTAVIPGHNYEGQVRELTAGIPSAPLALAPVTAGALGAGNVTSPINWGSDIIGLGKPADNAATTMTLNKVGTVGNLLIQGNHVKRLDAGSAWDTTAISAESYTGTAYVGGLIPGFAMIGLTDNPTGTSYIDLDFAWYWDGTEYQIWESGVQHGSFALTGQRLLITYDGVFVRYYANGVLKREVATTSGRAFRAGVATATIASEASELVFGPFSANDWSSIGGTGRPEDNATQSGLGPNMLMDDTFLGSHWALTSTAARYARVANDGFPAGFAPYFLELKPPVTGVDPAPDWNHNSYRRPNVTPGKRYFGSISVQRNAICPTNVPWTLAFAWFDASGTFLSNSGNLDVTTADLTAGAPPKQYQISSVAPAGAASVTILSYVGATATGAGHMRFESPRISEVGETYQINGPSTKTVKYDYTVTPLSGELPVNINFTLSVNGVTQTSGVAWTGEILSGILNGVGSDAGTFNLSGTGTGTLGIASLGTDTVSVRINATQNGVKTSFIFNAFRDIAAAPIGGGSGAIATGSVGGTTTSGTFADKSGSITGTMPSGKTTARILANLQNLIDTLSAIANETVEWKLERNISGTWTQIGSTVSSTARERNDVDFGWTATPGAVTLDINDTGLTAGATYSWRISARRSSGARTNYLSGDITVTAP